jgi:hypothetical protein
MTSTYDHNPHNAVPPSASDLQRLVRAELSLPPRLGYVALLLAASMMTTVIGALWLTEPALPARTQIAFAAMIGIGFSWIGFALWVLRNRRPLFAGHRIVAGRMAVTFTSLFVIGALAVGQTQDGLGPYVAAAVGLAMLATATVLLRRAHRTNARLIERRDALARELGEDRE